MMLKYGMKKMPHARAAMKGLAALFFAAMMLCGAMAAGEADPLRPDDLSYDNGNIVLHKQAERIAPDEWKIDVSATIKDSPVEPPQMEVVFVLDVSSTMNACAVMDQHNQYFSGGGFIHTHTDNCPKDCTATFHSHVSGSPNDCCYKMGGTNGTVYYPRRFDVAKDAIKELVSKLPMNNTEVTYTYFSDNNEDKIGEIKSYDFLLDPEHPYGLYGNISGQTYIMNGVDFGISKFSSNSDTEKILVLVTDGQATDGRYSSTTLTDFKGTVFTVGFNHHDQNLEGMAKNGGSYYTANNPGMLTEAFDDIAYKITTMIVDPMGEKMDFAGQSSTNMGILTEADDIIKWAPDPDNEDELVNKQVTYSYKVKLTDDADTSTAQTNSGIPLNDTTVFRYSITTNGTTQEYEREFPIPQATYAVSSVQVKWVDESNKEIQSPTNVESIICDWGTPAFATDYTTITETIPVPNGNGAYYQYVNTTYEAGSDSLGSAKDIDPSRPVAYVVTHHYVLVEPGQTGSLTITKSVEGGVTVPVGATFTVTYPDGSSQTITYADFTEGKYTLENLPVGEYTVTEDKDSAQVTGYSLTVEGNGNSAIVTKGGTASVTIKNTYTQDVGSLTIRKTADGADTPGSTKFTVTGPNNYREEILYSQFTNSEYTLSDLPVGEYTVTEDADSAQVANYTLTVDGSGSPVTVAKGENASVAIKNTYTQDVGSLTIKKTTAGAEVPSTAKFTVTGPNNYSTEVLYSRFADGAYTLTDLPVGEYTVTEDAATAQVAGYTLTVNGSGSAATVTKGGNTSVTIANTYTQDLGSLTITKTANGHAVPSTAKFTVTGPNNYSTEVLYSQFADGAYTLTDLPVGEYTVTEDETSAKVENYTLTVTVNPVTATVTKGANASVTIANTYTKSVGNLKVSKTVVNGDETKAFTFAVSPAETGGVSADAWSAWKAVEGNSAEFSLKHNESHTLRNLPLGKYTVTETNVPAGYTPDQAAKTVEVTNDDNASVGFVNTYAVGETTATLSVTKELTGRDMTAGEFSFELKNATGGVLQTKQNAANGSVTFDPITYETAGTHTYTISEIVPKDKAGVRYDTDTVSATVTVTDNGDGTLSADVKYADNDVTFINEYVPLAAEVVFTASKELTGRTLNAGEFSFELFEVKDGTSTKLKTATNAADGKVTFEAIKYKAAGVYTYTISEVQGNLVGVTYDKNAYPVSVEVTDDGKGKLTAVTTGAEDIVFKNSYEANGSVMLKARKMLEGSNLKPGMFSFELKDQTGTLLQTKQNGEEGLVIFDALNYTQDDVGKTFVYTISEVDNPNDFFTHDTTVHQISVTVSIGEDGRLEMALEGVDENNKVSFVNGVLPTEFRVTKIWEGGDGEITLTLYADGEKLDPQPVCTRNGNVYTYSGLPICDREGKQIVYWAVETPVEGFMTVYRNSGAFVNETGRVYNGGQIINRALTDVRVRKVWNGLRSDEVRPPITLTLYRNGVKMNVPTPVPDKDGWYTFPGLLMNDNGKAVVYTVKEEPVQGFVTTYINNGVESTDCAQNGGTIVNSKIPSTGDRSDLAFWMTMLAASGALLALTAVCRRKRMN